MSENDELSADELSADERSADESAQSNRQPRNRGAMAVRISVGVVAIAVAAAAVAGASWLTLPTVSSTPTAQTITPVSAEQQRVCAGPLLRLGDDQGQDASTASSLGNPTLQSAGDFRATPIGQSDAVGSTPTALTAPAGTAASDVSAAQSQAVSSGDIAGFAAIDCAEPSSDTWLVAGSNAVGRTSILTLTNPSALSATVELQLFGAAGTITAPGTTGIVVPAGSQRVFPLAGFMPSEPSPVVHVLSRGGAITATLQQTTVRGLDAGGVDVAGATSSPADTLVIPGVVVSGLELMQQTRGREGYDDLQNVLRVFVPGDEPASVQVGVVPDNGDPTGGTFQANLDPGVVTDLPIDVAGDGSYTVTIQSSVPVVAGARVSTAGSSAFDFAWLAAAPELSGDVQVSVPAGAGVALYLRNPTSDDLEVALSALGGEERYIPVAAGSSVVVPLAAASSYSLKNVAGLYAAVTYASDGALASYPVREPHAAAAPVTVFP